MINVIYNGFNISAVIDTGSGIPHLACTGATTDPAPRSWLGAIARRPTFEPTNGTPPFTLVAKGSTDCQKFCSQSYNGSCWSNPTVSGACEYYYQYGTGSLSARAYGGTMSFPGNVNTLSPTAQNVSNFLVGCAYQSLTPTSLTPYYMFSSFNALMGMDWAPLSMWMQMVTAGVVGNTMYICMGNGGDYSGTNQNGVVVLGNDPDVVITGASVGGEVITVTMLSTSIAVQLLGPKSMWIKITSISFTGSTSTTNLAMAAGNYLIDSGTSQLLLMPDAFASWNQ